MDKLTYLLSLRVFIEQGNDYITAFSFIVLLCLERTPVELQNLQNKINQKFQIDMPISILGTCVKHLIRKQWVDNKQAPFLTEQGEKQLYHVKESSLSSKAAIDLLIQEILSTFPESLKNTPKERVLQELILLIEQNARELSNNLKQLKSKEASKLSEIQKELISFCMSAEKETPNSFVTLCSVAQGVVINSLLNRKTLEKIDEKFENLEIFLDTNFIFSLIGLAEPEQQKASKELLNLIREHTEFSLKVFPFTLDEIQNFIQTFLDNKTQCRYRPTNLVSGARYKLSQMKESEIESLKVGLEKRLNSMGIIAIHAYSDDLSTNEAIRELEEFKNASSPYFNIPLSTIRHDVQACEWVKRLRKKTVYSLEDSRVLFLTLDSKLFNFVSKKMKGIKKGAIEEVITAEKFTAVLWIKKPKFSASLPLDNIIAGCKEKILIKEDVWNALIESFAELEKEGLVNEDEISLLETEHIRKDFINYESPLSSDENRQAILLAKKQEQEKQAKREEEIKTLQQKGQEQSKQIQTQESTITKQKRTISKLVVFKRTITFWISYTVYLLGLGIIGYIIYCCKSFYVIKGIELFGVQLEIDQNIVEYALSVLCIGVLWHYRIGFELIRNIITKIFNSTTLK